MNWIVISSVSVLLLALIGGGLYYYFVVMQSDANCCPKGFNRKYLFGVNAVAKCDNKTKRCKRCIGKTKPKDWKNKVEAYQGGIYVTDAHCKTLPF